MQLNSDHFDDEITTWTIMPDGHPAAVPFGQKMNFARGITVEAWIETTDSRAEVWQELVSQWTPLTSFDTFESYDAGNTSGLDSAGFFGAVFDGQFIYFVPQHNRTHRHGNVLRYNTHGGFQDAASWQAFDGGNTRGLKTEGYYGAVFDGRFVYFVPRLNDHGFHTNVLRYDTQGAFDATESWEAYNAQFERSYQSAGFDGRYIYFCPGHAVVPKAQIEAEPQHNSPRVTGLNSDFYQTTQSLILRYDTQSSFTDDASWTTYDAANTSGLDTADYDGAVFDGRYMYFMPLSTGALLRYDTTADFHGSESWTAYDLNPLGLKLSVGGVFDGRFLYVVPYGETEFAIRYDTHRKFLDAESWSAYRLADTPGLTTRGFDGGMFDGRYIYFVPFFSGSEFHGVTLRYDTQGGFLQPTSWQAVDSSQTGGLTTIGFNAGAFDGRYAYFAPWRDGSDMLQGVIGNGRVLRYDTLGESGTFSLRFCDYGHNGGLCAAVPGMRFLVNTSEGVRSVAANKVPQAGRHYIAATYDGSALKLYIDGVLVGEQAGSGQIVGSDLELSLGRMLNGGGEFRGKVERVRVSGVARDGAWVAEEWRS